MHDLIQDKMIFYDGVRHSLEGYPGKFEWLMPLAKQFLTFISDPTVAG